MKAVEATGKDAEPTGAGRRRALLLGLLGVGLLLAGAAIALAIALPLTLRFKSSNASGTRPVELQSGDEPVGVVRKYYVAAEPINWDYIPSKKNLCKNEPFAEDQAIYVSAGIGSKYKKAVYREYMDATFASPVQLPPEQLHMGLLGPAIHAEVGDTIEVTMKNSLPFPVNMEPGGVQYADPVSVNTGDTYTYRWVVPRAAGPAADGPSTQLWMYRSTVDLVGNTQAGLVGPLVIARPGSLAADGRRAGDVDKEFFVVMESFDETASPFYEENKAPFAKELANMTETDVLDSAKKHALNGYTFCNLPGLNMTVGDRARWYVASFGNEDAIHTAHWHGIVFNHSGHHVDQMIVQSSTMLVLDAYTDNPGTWLFHCHLSDHMDGGMMALFHINGTAPSLKLGGKERVYYVGAVEEVWDYAPFGGEMCGATLVNFSDAAKTFVEPGPDRIGRKYIKALYREFTDDTFTERKRRAPEWEHLGVMGPVIRGAVGDTIKIVFKNMLEDNSVSMHPHGVFYDKGSEGSPYYDGLPAAAGDSVAPGKSVVYNWTVPERAGPAEKDFSSIMWMYHSHVSESMDPYGGLYGALIISRADMADEEGRPKDVDKEFVLSFAILDESSSILTDKNIAKYLPRLAKNATAVEALKEDPGFQESNLMHGINGYLYCNLPGFELLQGAESRIYFLGLGSSSDMHTPNSAESQFYLDGRRKQSLRLLPGGMWTADVTPMAPGKGLLQCHVYDHIAAGMSALYNVKNMKAIELPTNPTVRKYYIAAEPYTWDYAPHGYDGCNGAPFTEAQSVFTKTTNETMGSMYKKAHFVGYTDATFKTPVQKPDYFGILGPMLKAEVGDVVEVHFINRMLVNSSFQPFGGLVPIENTSPYQLGLVHDANATAGNQGMVAAAGRRLLREAVAGRQLQQITAAQAEAEAVITQSVDNLYALGSVGPQETRVYRWLVPDDVMGPRDDTSVVYAYVSGVDHIKHINAGLVGPLVIYDKGKLDDPGFDLEVPLFFNIQNELQSLYLEDNIKVQEQEHKVKIHRNALTFPESNLMHSLNGFVYCNMPTLQLKQGAKVRWYVMGFGSEGDMHSPVFPGQSVVYAGQPTFSVELMPANTFVLDMAATGNGSWVYYCNIFDHYTSGMSARMVVN